MDDINANTAVLSIYDPVLDNTNTNANTNTHDVRLMKNNHTEAWFTRVPELQSVMPICESLEIHLRSCRRFLINSKINTRTLNNSNANTNNNTYTNNDYLFDLCFFNSMTPAEINIVRDTISVIHHHNHRYIGNLTQPSSWKFFLRYNKRTQQTEFHPDSFMQPIKGIIIIIIISSSSSSISIAININIFIIIVIINIIIVIIINIIIIAIIIIIIIIITYQRHCRIPRACRTDPDLCRLLSSCSKLLQPLQRTTATNIRLPHVQIFSQEEEKQC